MSNLVTPYDIVWSPFCIIILHQKSCVYYMEWCWFQSKATSHIFWKRHFLFRLTLALKQLNHFKRFFYNEIYNARENKFNTSESRKWNSRKRMNDQLYQLEREFIKKGICIIKVKSFHFGSVLIRITSNNQITQLHNPQIEKEKNNINYRQYNSNASQVVKAYW